MSNMKKNKKVETEEIEEEKKFKLIDIFRNKRYYAIANLVFWFGIILVLIVIARITPSTSSNIKDNSLPVTSEFNGFSYIKNKNFNFKYTLLVDEGIISINNEKHVKETVLEGKQYNTKLLFKDNKNNEYFIQDSLILKKENNNFVLSNNPCEYFNYIDVDLIEEILLNSTKDNDGGYILELSKYLEIIGKEDKNNETSDKTIYIDITKNESDIITKIEIDLSEYLSITDSTLKSIELKLEYSAFGEIEDFDIKK